MKELPKEFVAGFPICKEPIQLAHAGLLKNYDINIQ